MSSYKRKYDVKNIEDVNDAVYAMFAKLYHYEPDEYMIDLLIKTTLWALRSAVTQQLQVRIAEFNPLVVGLVDNPDEELLMAGDRYEIAKRIAAAAA